MLFRWVPIVLMLVVFASGCAPQKVKVYESASGIRGDIIQMSASLMGKPYRNGAKGPDSFDCSGFVHYVFKQSRVTLPITVDAIIKMGYEVPRDGVLPGDLVFFKISGELHMGIMLNNKDFVHASKSRGVVVDDVDSGYWRRRFLSFRTVL